MNKYRELFCWWFKLGLKICLAYSLIISVPGMISLIAEGPRTNMPLLVEIFIMILTVVTFIIGVSLLFGLVAVGLKRIREDELLKLFWK